MALGEKVLVAWIFLSKRGKYNVRRDKILCGEGAEKALDCQLAHRMPPDSIRRLFTLITVCFPLETPEGLLKIRLLQDIS